MKKLIIISLFVAQITVVQTIPGQVKTIQTKLKTSEIINLIFSEAQKSKEIDVYSREAGKISVDQVISIEQKKVLITILSEGDLKKKQLSSFSEIVELVKQQESGNYEYPQVEEIFILKNIEQDVVIVAMRDKEIVDILEKFL
jgi:hypothetical protein